MCAIKFRCWHKGYGKKNQAVMLYDNKPGDCFRWLAEGQPVEIEQFTGLRDSLGKEIYEGDVLEWAGLKLPITVDDYHGYRFMFGKDQLCKAFAVDGKIIGNIHEERNLNV